VTSLSSTLLGCQRPQRRLALHNKLLQRRNALHCIAKIVQDNKGIAAPTYMGMMINFQKKTKELIQFFFCNDDIERCVKGSRRRWAKSRPDVPCIWPMKLGTNLTKKEIQALGSVGFHLP
jgi:hypothetical protein